MTDITELAQRARINAECGEHLSPAETIELVEALEKAQTKANVYDMLRDDYGLREKGVGLADFVDWQAKRIAELESRTVKLPDFRHEHFNSDWGEHDAEAYQVALREALIAAGIKVEAE